MPLIKTTEVSIFASPADLPKFGQGVSVADTIIKVNNQPDSLSVGSFSTASEIPTDFSGIAVARDTKTIYGANGDGSPSAPSGGSGITGYTWATKPNPTTNSGAIIKVTDLGNNPTLLFHSDGTRYKIEKVNTYASTGIMMVVPSSGTMGNNGALTLTTSLNNPTVTAGTKAFIYLPANAISAGSAAGLYYIELSAANAGTVFNNLYTVDTFDYPASPTPFATTGPGAYTQSTATDIDLYQYTIKGGVLDANATISMVNIGHIPNNGNNKTVKVKFGGSTVYSSAGDTGSLNINRTASIANLNDVAKQFTTSATASTAGLLTAVDTSIDQVIKLSVQIAVATDYLVFRNTRIQIS